MAAKTDANHDTLELLKECDQGVKMAISAIEQVVDDVKSNEFKSLLDAGKDRHTQVQEKIGILLIQYGEAGKAPGAVAKGMSKMKISVMMAADGSDSTAAELITDGCNMGIKSLSQYLNQYTQADGKAKDAALQLIKSEEELAKSIRKFL